MAHYASCYDPPLVADLEADREDAWADEGGRQIFLHVGFFMYWYASAELAITALLHRYTGSQHPAHFHVLTRGMDAKLKCERLKEAVKMSGGNIDPALSKRFDHLSGRIASIRNQLAHNFVYYSNATFQLVSLGAPPHDADDPIDGAPKPETIPALELFERGKWVQAFSNDLWEMANSMDDGSPAPDTLGRAGYWSSLPTGDRPSPEKQARRAKADKRAQNPAPK